MSRFNHLSTDGDASSTPAGEKDPLNAFWQKYLELMEEDDERRAHEWDGNTTGILTFTGLFAATVAAFVIEGYKQLSVDSGDETVELLKLLIAIQNSTALPISSAINDSSFDAPVVAVISNALWFCSLVISLGCALLATLVQQWARDYKRDMKSRNKLDEDLLSRAYNHIYLRMGVDLYGMDQIVYVIVSLMHLSVFLFAGGLLLFLFPLNSIVAWYTTAVLGLLGAAYIVASILPIYHSGCPYRTPLTYLLAAIAYLFSWIAQCVARSLYALGSHLPWRCRSSPSSQVQPPLQIKIIHRRRRLHRSHAPILRTKHFVYALSRYMSHQTLVTDAEIASLLHALLRMVNEQVLPDSRPGCIDHLCENQNLQTKLQAWAWDPSHTRDMAADAQISVLHFSCVLLQRLRRIDDSDTTEEHRVLMKHCASILLNIIGPNGSLGPRMRGDTRCMFRARCALFYMRHFLLSLSGGDVSRRHYRASLEVPSSDKSRQFSRGAESMAGELLTLLNTSLYNVLDMVDIPGVHHAPITDGPSCLVPLHDAGCCRSPNGPPTHMAACNVLTLIAHVMYTPEHDRNIYLSSELSFPNTFYFDEESVKGPLPFWAWYEYFKMKEEDQQLPPSVEFQMIIQNVDRLIGLRAVRSGLYESFIDALRNLQDHVDTRVMPYKLEGHGGFGPWAKKRMTARHTPVQPTASAHDIRKTTV
ncbi:unnamed protein product [Peniophora sp. CBMAI 1063]|nr:unnamed protein product [Peniophora sp. CBMAI 1063]